MVRLRVRQRANSGLGRNDVGVVGWMNFVATPTPSQRGLTVRGGVAWRRALVVNQ